MVITAFKSSPEIFASPWGLPHAWRFDNFVRAWTTAEIARNFLNSVLVTFGSLLFLLPIGAMAAYIFARYPFRGSRWLYTAFVVGMMFPLFLTIVPLFLLMTQFGLINDLRGLTIVYVAYSLPFTIFVLSGFFAALPSELHDAAMIDGCTHAQAFWRVMLPLARPGIVVVALFDGIGLWNEYPLALVLASDTRVRTLPLGIANLVMTDSYQSDWGALFASLVIVMIPVLIVYWIFRDSIHRTMVAGALKG